MTPWNSLDKEIVAALCEAATVNATEIHIRYKLSPISIWESVQRLTEAGLVQVEGSTIGRSATFDARVFELRHEIYARPTPWKL